MYPAGAYTVLYDGSGTISYAGGATRNAALSGPGMDVISVAPTGGIALYITATDPANYIRNIRVIAPGGRCENDRARFCLSTCEGGVRCVPFTENYQTERFHPHFLNSIKNYAVLRLMNWAQTNTTTLSAWADRPRLAEARWGIGRGVPFELMADLARVTGADLWINLPHLVTDEFAQSAAQLLHQTLPSTTRVYVEYSNEVWNSIFPQAQYARTQGAALSSDAFTGQIRWYSRRAVQLLNLFRDNFGSDPNRVVRVMGAQSGNTYSGQQALGFEGASTRVDALAIAPYFGAGYGGPTGGPIVQNFTVPELIGALRVNELPSVFTSIEQFVALANSYSLPLIAYEGGQHLVGYSGQENNPTLDALFNAANRSDLMEGLYDEYLAGWWTRNPNRMFVHYKNAATFSRYSKFGGIEYLNQPADQTPKYRALQSYIELHR